MLSLALALLTTPQDPVTRTNPGLGVPFSEPQNIEGLLIAVPGKLQKLPDQNPTFRAYQAIINSTSETDKGITQVVNVVVTDLDKLENKPTPEQVCDLHDRASRTREGYAAQLFKSERTEIDDKPMVVVIGSLLGRSAADKEINIFHTSAAFSTDTKAYEITWLNYYGGDNFTNAIKSVRSISILDEASTHQPKKLVGTTGNYSLLGLPYNFLLPKPATAKAETTPSKGQKARYLGEIKEPDWFATAEIAVMEESIEDTSPKNLLKLLGYATWVDLNPEFELVDGMQVCKELAITEDRHARIDIVANETQIIAVVVSAPKDKPLPTRSVIGLTK